MTEKMNDGWIEWHGGDCPVNGMPVGSVEARFRDGNENVLMFEPYYSCAALWEHTEDFGVPGSNGKNIIAYRIIADQEARPTESKIPDRHELQKDGKHPAPCAKFCESNACESQIRRLNNEASRFAEQINQQAIKMADVESQRDELLAALIAVADNAKDDDPDVWKMVHETIERVKECK